MKDNKVVSFRKSSEELLGYAYKKIEKKQYVNALSILKNANEQDPDNVDVLVEMAEIYGMMGMAEKANAYAYYAMLQKPNKESLYILGANYLKSYQYETGRRFLDRLIAEYPEDEYADFAGEILANIDSSETLTDEMRLLRLSDKGKHLIEAGNYKKAIRLYRRLYDINSEATYIKNNLALSYFYDNEEQRAIALCKEVLEENPYDIYANCNLILFYYKTRQEKQLALQKKKLARLQPSYHEEYIKMVATYCEMDEHEMVTAHLEQMMQLHQMDTKALYLLAAASYNLGSRSKAIDILSDMLKIDEFNYIAHFYLKAIKAQNPILKMEYYMQIPFLAILDSIKQIKELVALDGQELQSGWDKDDMMVTIWGLYYGDDGLKRLCVNLLATIGEEDCENILREYLFKIGENDDVKKEVFSALQFMGAKQPYIAFFSGTVVEVNVSLVESDFKHLSPRDQKTIAILKDQMQKRLSDSLAQEGIALLLQLLEEDGLFACSSNEALAACIEYMIRVAHNKPGSQTELAEAYGIEPDMMEQYLQALDDIIQGSALDK